MVQDQLFDLSGFAQRFFRTSKPVAFRALKGCDHLEPFEVALFALLFLLLFTKRFHYTQPIERGRLSKTKSERPPELLGKLRDRYHGTHDTKKLADYIAWLAEGAQRKGLKLACCGWVV